MEIIVNPCNLLYTNLNDMENIWKSVMLAEEVVKFQVLHDFMVKEYVKPGFKNSPMTLHHYRDSINYQDKIVVNYRDIGFTIITQP